MKTIKIDLGRDLRYVNIIALADLHIGDKYFNEKDLKSKLETAMNDDEAFLILNGDLINNATKTSVSDIYTETMSPIEQLQKAKEIFEPYKDKILAITGGNHERRTYRMDGIDLTQILARELGLEDRYADEGALLFIRFGEQSRGTKETNGSGKVRQMCYTVYVTHGSGGGRSVGGKSNALEQLSSIVDADIYIHSHTHLPVMFKQSFLRTDLRNSSVQEVDKLFVNTSAWLDYGGYGQIAKYTPASKSFTTIHLDGSTKMFGGSII